MLRIERQGCKSIYSAAKRRREGRRPCFPGGRVCFERGGGVRIAVSGASGYVGRSFSKRATDLGMEVVVLRRSNGILGSTVLGRESAGYGESLRRAIAVGGLSAFVHAGFPMRCSAEEMLQAAEDEIERLVPLLVGTGIRLVLVSSFSVFDWTCVDEEVSAETPMIDETNWRKYGHYAQAKAAQERKCTLLCHQYGIPLTVVRPSMIWDDSNLPHSVIGLLRWNVQFIFRPDRPLHIVHINRVVDVLLNAVASQAPSEVVLANDERSVSAIQFSREKYPHVVRVIVPNVVTVCINFFSPFAEWLAAKGFRVPDLLIRERLAARFPTAAVRLAGKYAASQKKSV